MKLFILLVFLFNLSFSQERLSCKLNSTASLEDLKKVAVKHNLILEKVYSFSGSLSDSWFSLLMTDNQDPIGLIRLLEIECPDMFKHLYHDKPCPLKHCN